MTSAGSALICGLRRATDITFNASKRSHFLPWLFLKYQLMDTSTLVSLLLAGTKFSIHDLVGINFSNL